ncbi:conserved hypothetical protein [Haloferula helveola]|uniref:DUF4328 domain-containing protein n=1 Tax=Haloferula helveola TaxID=490095 RepID=A0ABN6H7K7_9BACT|nr:conserved hypothetical protein [Haloferula helveola]
MSELDPYSPPEVAVVVEERKVPEGVQVSDPTSLSRWSIGLLVVATLIDLVDHIWLTTVGRDSLSVGILDGVEAQISGFVYLANVIVFLCWSYRVLKNAQSVDPGTQTVSPGWGVGSYFVPIVNLWIPAKALMQASRVSGTSVGLVLAWWLVAMGIIVLAVAYIFWAFNAPMEDWDTYSNAPTGFDHVITVVDLVSVWLEVVMILGLTRVHREWAASSPNIS